MDTALQMLVTAGTLREWLRIRPQEEGERLEGYPEELREVARD